MSEIMIAESVPDKCWLCGEKSLSPKKGNRNIGFNAVHKGNKSGKKQTSPHKRCRWTKKLHSGSLVCGAYQDKLEILCSNDRAVMKSPTFEHDCLNSRNREFFHHDSKLQVTCPVGCKEIAKSLAETLYYYRVPYFFHTKRGVKKGLFKDKESLEKILGRGKWFVAFDNPNDKKSRILSAAEVWENDERRWHLTSLGVAQAFVKMLGCWKCHQPLKLVTSTSCNEAALRRMFITTRQFVNYLVSKRR